MRIHLYAVFFAIAACTAAPTANAVQEQAANADGPDSVLEGAALPEKPKIDSLLPVAAEGSLARKADFAEAMQDVAERQKVFDDEPTRYSLTGVYSQGGLVFGETEPGAQVRLDGDDVMVGADGKFVFRLWPRQRANSAAGGDISRRRGGAPRH